MVILVSNGAKRRVFLPDDALRDRFVHVACPQQRTRFRLFHFPDNKMINGG
jgi:hypothetical protein